MSDEEKPFDIFHQPPKKPHPPSRPPPSAPKGPPPSDDEVKKMMNRMSDIREELNESMLDMLSQHGITMREVLGFMDNPKNFSDQQWHEMQEERKKKQDKLWKDIGTKQQQVLKEKKKKKKTKRMRGKTLGSRKKWLEM